LKFNKPELTIEIDRERARALGVTVRDIASTLQLYFSGQRYGYFVVNGKQYSSSPRPTGPTAMNLSTSVPSMSATAPMS